MKGRFVLRRRHKVGSPLLIGAAVVILLCILSAVYSGISGNLFSFLTRNVLFHPLPGGVRYQDKRAPVMDISETFISRGRDNQKPFLLITTLKRSASDHGHEDWLAVFTMDEISSSVADSSRLQHTASDRHIFHRSRVAVCAAVLSPFLPSPWLTLSSRAGKLTQGQDSRQRW